MFSASRNVLIFVDEILVQVFLRIRFEFDVKDQFPAIRVTEDDVVRVSEAVRVSVRCRASPGDFILKEVLAENLVEHDFDVVAGVPVAVVIEAAGFLEDACSSTQRGRM